MRCAWLSGSASSALGESDLDSLSSVRSALDRQLAGRVQPVRGFEASQLLEVLGVVGDKHEVERHCVRGNQGIQRSDGGALGLEGGADPPKCRGSGSVERDNFNS